MFDLVGQPTLDKSTLIGSCARLPLKVDADRLQAEVAALPVHLWGTTAGRVGVHRAADAIFLRGHAPAEGDLPIEERPALAHLPYVRMLIEQEVGRQPLRCLIAHLPAGASIPPHIDLAPYFTKALRVHVPVESHDRAWMVCAGESFVMRPGEAWALNNSALHAVWNAHPTRVRIHIICDFLPDPVLLGHLRDADRRLGRSVPEVDAHMVELMRPG